MAVAHYFRDIVEGKRTGPGVLLLRILFLIFSIPYGLILHLRALAYAWGLLRSFRLSKPVISVGNITVGGTGKTPMVALLASYYISKGKRVAVLSRGYGGSLHGETRIVSDGREIFLTPGEAGDEPFMLATRIPGLLVVIGPDRYKAGLFAQERLDPDIFILDDGFQHVRLKRDLNILLLNRSKPFGNGCVLPAGLLREYRSAAKRADLVIYTRCGNKEPDTQIPGIPFCLANHKIAEVIPLGGATPLPLSRLASLCGMAFAGIAEPSHFFAMLEDAGLKISGNIAFADHCRYGEKEIAEIVLQKNLAQAEYLITTEKDAVKLSPYLKGLGDVYVAVLEVEIRDMMNLEHALQKVLVSANA